MASNLATQLEVQIWKGGGGGGGLAPSVQTYYCIKFDKPQFPKLAWRQEAYTLHSVQSRIYTAPRHIAGLRAAESNKLIHSVLAANIRGRRYRQQMRSSYFEGVERGNRRVEKVT